MCWLLRAEKLFSISKPDSFCDSSHCEECAEHNETLKNNCVKTIGIEELGNQGWDPICFCSEEGKLYYMPALIRLSLETLGDEFYFEQFLFHLEYDGQDNELYKACNEAQRIFIAQFIESMIENHAEEIERNFAADKVLQTYKIWSHT